MIKTISKDIRLSRIRLLSCDVDGVLTDGGLYYDSSGKELRRYNVLDGMGIKMLQKANIEVCIITQSNTMAIRHRADKLGIRHCYMGIENKYHCFLELLEELGLLMEEAAHIGDDVNDLGLLEKVGIPITVANGVSVVKEKCMFITTKKGGEGAIREVADAILESKNTI